MPGMNIVNTNMIASGGAHYLSIRLAPGAKVRCISARNATTPCMGIKISLGGLSEPDLSEGILPLAWGIPSAGFDLSWYGDIEVNANSARVVARFDGCAANDDLQFVVGAE